MANDLTTYRGTPTFVAADAKFGTAGLGGAGVMRSATADSFLRASGGTIADGTVEGWVKTTTASATQVCFGHENVYWAAISNGKLIVNVKTGSGSTNANIGTTGPTASDGAWHHIAVVFASGVCNLYVDGALIETSAAVSTSGGAGNGFTIGGIESAGFDWVGSIDEVRVSDQIRYRGTYFTVPTAAFGNSA